MLNIEKLRTEKGLSKNMLCKKSGISLKAYLAIINAGDVKLSTLKKIAKALEVKVQDLFDDVPDK